jgi:hypothetical protein
VPLFRSRLDDQAIKIVSNCDLAAETTGVREIRYSQVQKIGLRLSGATDSIAKLLADPHVASGTGELSTALSDNAWNAGANSRTHDGVANLRIYHAFVVTGSHVDDFWHSKTLSIC